jgi:hypothetical protein
MTPRIIPKKKHVYVAGRVDGGKVFLYHLPEKGMLLHFFQILTRLVALDSIYLYVIILRQLYSPSPAVTPS